MKDKKTSVAAIIGLVFGILALLLSAVPIVNNFAFVLALTGLVCGIIGLLAIRKEKRTGTKLAWSAVGLSVLSILIVLVTQQIYSDAIDQVAEEATDSIDRATGDKTDDILGKDVTVDIAKFTVTTDEFGLNTTTLPVTVVNKLSEKKSYSIQIEAVTADGERIADDYVYANDLGPNQTQKFKAFQFVEDSKVEALKSAEFKIVNVSQT